MKKLLLLALLLGVALLAGCGLQEPSIEVTAASVNLSTEDLEEPAELVEEYPLDAISSRINQTPDANVVQDANMRVFLVNAGPVTDTQAPGGTQLTSLVMVYTSASNARAVLDQTRQNIEQALQTEYPNLRWERVDGAKVGDESSFTTASLPDEGAQVYLYLFRKNNVLGLVETVGPAGAVDANWVTTLAQKMATRIPTAEN